MDRVAPIDCATEIPVVSTLQRPVDPAAIRRVALIRPRFLGDVCLTLPALDAVREACPQAQVAYMVEEESAPLVAEDPRLFQVIVASRRRSRRHDLTPLARLRRFRPDLVIDFFCNPRTAIWTGLSGARVRVGYPGKGWRSSLYSHHVRPRTLSAVEFHLASVAALGWPAPVRTPRLAIGSAARAAALTALRAAGADSPGPWVGFHPGARWPTRRWEPERFAALAERFLAHFTGGMAVISGGPGEAEAVERIIERLPRGRAIPVVGWPIARFVALQSMCRAFVCGDTGPLHTAVAAGTPTLGLLSRNSPAMFFPYPAAEGHRAYYARAECSPCHRDQCADLRCLHRLTVEGAWALLSTMLDTDRRGEVA